MSFTCADWITVVSLRSAPSILLTNWNSSLIASFQSRLSVTCSEEPYSWRSSECIHTSNSVLFGRASYTATLLWLELLAHFFVLRCTTTEAFPFSFKKTDEERFSVSVFVLYPDVYTVFLCAFNYFSHKLTCLSRVTDNYISKPCHYTVCIWRTLLLVIKRFMFHISVFSVEPVTNLGR